MEVYKDEWEEKEFTAEEKKAYIKRMEDKRFVTHVELQAKDRQDKLHRQFILERKQKALDKENAQLKLGREKPYFDSIPKDISVCTDDLDTTKKRLRHNQLLSSYYLKLYDEENNSKLLYSCIRLSESIANCTTRHYGDFYQFYRVFDIKNTNACKNRFCMQCQKVLANKRIVKYGKLFSKIEESYDYYHLSVTVPNVYGKDLQKTIDRLLWCFGYIIRLFSGHYKPKIQMQDEKNKPIFDEDDKPVYWDFSKLGYIGAMRTAEITYTGDYYHPHLHCFFALKKDLDIESQQVIKNVFSKSKSNGIHLFSPLEILLQKIWRIHYDNSLKEVKPKNVTNAKILSMSKNDGYSLVLQKVKKGDYFEVFKYVVKPHSDFMSYEQFKVLNAALENRRILQGYGCFFGIKDEEIDDENDPEYDLLIGQLKLLGNPIDDCRTLEQLREDIKNGLRVISRKRVKPIGDKDEHKDKEE